MQNLSQIHYSGHPFYRYLLTLMDTKWYGESSEQNRLAEENEEAAVPLISTIIYVVSGNLHWKIFSLHKNNAHFVVLLLFIL